MSAKPSFGFALEYVSDIEAAKRFYVEVMGLGVERYHPTYVQFEHFAIASDESVGGSDAPELYWLVDDAEATFRELSGKAEVATPIKEMPFGKVFAINDPDGRPRYVLEFARDRPSQPADGRNG